MCKNPFVYPTFLEVDLAKTISRPARFHLGSERGHVTPEFENRFSRGESRIGNGAPYLKNPQTLPHIVGTQTCTKCFIGQKSFHSWRKNYWSYHFPLPGPELRRSSERLIIEDDIKVLKKTTCRVNKVFIIMYTD